MKTTEEQIDILLNDARIHKKSLRDVMDCKQCTAAYDKYAQTGSFIDAFDAAFNARYYARHDLADNVVKDIAEQYTELAIKAYQLDQIRLNPPRYISMSEILAITANYFGIDIYKIRGYSRASHKTHARHVAIYMIRKNLPFMSWSDIAKHFGERHPSSMGWGYRKNPSTQRI